MSQEEATAIDLDLLGPEVGFLSEQLMELAGYSVAQAILQVYPPDRFPCLLIICGPGNKYATPSRGDLALSLLISFYL